MRGGLSEPAGPSDAIVATGFQAWSANYDPQPEEYRAWRLAEVEYFREQGITTLPGGMTLSELEAIAKEDAQRLGPHFLHTIVDAKNREELTQGIADIPEAHAAVAEFLAARYIYADVWDVDDGSFHIEFAIPPHLEDVPLAIVVLGDLRVAAETGTVLGARCSDYE